MRLLYRYRGLDGEKALDNITHVIVDSSVTVIKRMAFKHCYHIVSIIMGDNVKGIEEQAFFNCCALRFIRLSNKLEYIGVESFGQCCSLEALFLPSAVKAVEKKAFYACSKLRLLILPHEIDLKYVGSGIIYRAAIYRIAMTDGVTYDHGSYGHATAESNLRVNEWLVHHMDEAPFHQLCYNSSVDTQKINEYLIEQENGYSGLHVDTIHGMTPLHILAMNPHAPADSITTLLHSNFEAVFCLDVHQKTPLEYARDHNVSGLVGMIVGLCNQRNSSTILVELDTNDEIAL